MNELSGIGPNRANLLLRHFGSPENIFSADEKEICGIEGISHTMAAEIKKGFCENTVREQLKQAKELGIDIITLADSRYPELLKSIHAPPAVLYVRGTLQESDVKSIGIVGTRRISAYARQATRMITEELTEAGATIVSGMARGVDTVAHMTAIRNGGRTIAVLGCGLDTCYPPESGELMNRITQNGAVISEFPIGAPPDTFHFPRRNRIISGLSQAVLVTQAGEKSGALITADFALEQGREVFAVPGPITATGHIGCNRLIRNGAGLASCGGDILEPLYRIFGKKRDRRPEKDEPVLSREEELVYQHLSYEPLHIDNLSDKCGQPGTRVLSILLNLELKGIIQQTSGKNFVRAE